MITPPAVTHNPHRRPPVEAFSNFYVGIDSLEFLAAREDRVCVLNILGNESRSVTPTSHNYSGGNVVCGVQPGRSGSVLKTEMSDIPVYNTVAEALKAGHKFNVAVVYVPPAGVKDAVIEAVRVNPALTKLIILTEKVPLADARVIRQYCQMQRVDVFGGNCLGIADAHHHVRLGGALGGSEPTESLVPGTVAIYSNSGNFTTTIAVYLLTAGWGTTVSLSSGKDVYIHFAAQEFVHAFHNDRRSRAMVMYVEPGGYYERDLVFEKPVVVCVVGRWKDRLTRACGHAGAIAGSGDNAAAKEQWFMDKFGVDGIFTVDNPICSAKGAVVTNIADIPTAMTAVMALNKIEPDFAPRGNLSLKCWFADETGLELPDALDLDPVPAIEPYREQIDAFNNQMGVVPPRESMKDASGASMMDPRTQITRLHGHSVLDLATHSYEDNLVLALLHEFPDDNGRALANIALNACVNLHGTPMLAAAAAAPEARHSPNTQLCAALAIIGPKLVQRSQEVTRKLLQLLRDRGMSGPTDAEVQFAALCAEITADDGPGGMLELFTNPAPEPCSENILAGMRERGAESIFVRLLVELAEYSGRAASSDALLGAIACHLAWPALVHKRISMMTMANLPWHLRIMGAVLGATVDPAEQTATHFRGVPNAELVGSWSFTETAYLALLTKRPSEGERFAFQVLLGLVVSNGPGTISSQGAKGAVSADGPEAPERVQVNKAYVGFLTHCGYAHGGNGFEAIQFLLGRFRDTDLPNPGNREHGIDLVRMAADYAQEYKVYKTKAKNAGNLSYAKVPCINHPVFKGNEVNYDPREVFVSELFEQHQAYNIFHDFYHELVKALASYGVSENVYCVNVDAVIAVILLKMLWQPYRTGEIDEQFMEFGAFATFLYGRTVGSAAEIEDHVNRGRNMDTRSPASQCRFVG